MALPPETSARPAIRDERWQRWVAKGLAHDRELRQRARVVALVILSTVSFWLAVRLTLG